MLHWLRSYIRSERSAARDLRRAARQKTHTLKLAVLWSLAGLALFFLVDGALFHSGLYNLYLEPNSSAGELEGHLHWLDHAPAYKHEVLVAGDSRIAEGFSARNATAATDNRLHFTNFGIPGSSPRVWYYMIRDADPDRDRFDAIVLALGQYSDEDLIEDSQDRPIDVNFLVGRLRYTDCFNFAQSFVSPAPKRAALRGCFFRGIALRPDLQTFLHAPAARVKRAKDWMANGQGYIDGYGGKPETVAGLTADFSKRTLSFPPGVKPWQTDSIRSTVFPEPAQQTGLQTRYRQQWLGGIVELYRNSKTRIIFSEVPRAPLSTPDAKTPPRFLEQAAKQPRVSVLPASTFRDLERPDIFADGLHLNHEGRPIYSMRLGERVAALLGSH